MDDKELVSVLIPCYNGAKTLRRCLESLLQQTYRKIEVVIVNDGSTDNSEEIILSYVKEFEACGMKVIYIKQNNQGLGGAINTALKCFTGEFLCWGDCDDFWIPESIQYRVDFLKQHSEYGCVSSDAYVFDESDLLHPIALASASVKDIENPKQFMNHLTGIPLFCPGTHMIRTEAFLQANPNRYIFPAKHGQNHQLLMPVYYHFTHAFLNKPLYGYVIYSNSMSHKGVDSEQALNRSEEYCDILKNTILQIDMPSREKKRYLRIVKGQRCRGRWYYGLKKHNYQIFIKNVVEQTLIGQLKYEDKIQLIMLIKKRFGKINGI